MARLTRSARRTFLQILRDRKGSIATVTAMSFTAIVGFVGLGSEASYWYVTKRNMQGVTDSAAFTGGAALMKSDGIVNAAKAVAANYGFVDGANHVSVTVNNPPQSGAYTGNNAAVEVIIRQPQTRLFSSLFMASDPVIMSRSVALVGGSCTGSSCGCVLALDQSAFNDVKDSGAATLNMQSCSLYVNSDSKVNALWLTGIAQINAYSAYVDGTILGGSNLHTTNGAFQNTGTVTPDPYGNVAIPPITPSNRCDHQSTDTLPSNLTPGVYCGGLPLNNAGSTYQSYTMAPGTYYVKGGDFKVNGNINLTGTGVTIILTGDPSDPSSYAHASVNGNGNVTLSAPTSGALEGLIFYQDRLAPYSTTPQINKFNGGSTLNLNGAIYFPNQLVDYAGNSTTSPALCTQLVAYAINFSGNTAFNANNCGSAGVASIGVTSVTLVE